VAEANLRAVSCQLPALGDLDDRAFNVGTGVETSVNRLATLIGEAAGRTPEISHAPERAGELRRNALRVDKAARGLGWRPRTTLPEGVATTVRWLGED
jgi:UDP-glucose 4-epimerase